MVHSDLKWILCVSIKISDKKLSKIDIKDAYYSVPIHENDQKYLKFMYNGKLYMFTCLPNGLCSGPRKFTKLLKPLLARLVSGYIHDLITMSKTFNTFLGNLKLCVSLTNSLGFVIS